MTGEPATESDACHSARSVLARYQPDGVSTLDLDVSQVLAEVVNAANRSVWVLRPPLTPRDLATLLGRAGVPGFADELLRHMASPLHGTLQARDDLTASAFQLTLRDGRVPIIYATRRYS